MSSNVISSKETKATCLMRRVILDDLHCPSREPAEPPPKL